METGKIFGFFCEYGVVSLVSDDAMIDIKTGSIGTSIASALSVDVQTGKEFQMVKGCTIKATD